MSITLIVNIGLFILGLLFRVFLYSYRVINEPKRILNTGITKNLFNQWYFVIHMYFSVIASTIGLYLCVLANSWLAFFILDAMIWVTSVFLLVLGINKTATTFGPKIGTFVVIRNITEIVVHGIIGYLTYYNMIPRTPWLNFIIFGLWAHRITDTYPRFYIFRKNETFDLIHIFMTYGMTIGQWISYYYQSRIFDLMLDGLTLAYLVMTVGFIYVYQWNTENWRDLGPLILVYRALERDKLQKNNIHKTPKNLDENLLKVYEDEQTQYKRWGIDSNKFRTITGYGSSIYNKINGAVGQYYGKNITIKNVKDQYIHKITEKDMSDPKKELEPSPVDVSRKLFVRDDSKGGFHQKYNEKLKQGIENGLSQVPNGLFAYWTQFMIDDWVRIRTESDPGTDLIPLPKTSKHRSESRSESRSKSSTHTVLGSFAGKTFVASNDSREPFVKDDIKYYQSEKAHWWNTATLYGATLERYKDIRDPPSHKNGHRKGLIKVNENYLPLDEQGTEITGITININSARGALHYTFAKFHNAIATKMQQIYPQMEDEAIRQTVRLIVSASIAKIHVLEWTTALLNEPVAELTQHIFIDGVFGPGFSKLFGGISRFQGKVKFSDNTLTGIMGGTLVKNNSFAHTLEFQTVYKLHQLVPSNIHIKTGAGLNQSIDLGVIEQSFARSPDIFVKAGVKMHNFIEAMGLTVTGTFDVFNVSEEMMHIPMSSPESKSKTFMDIMASTIWRDRERGVYRYNAFRKGLGLNTFDTVDDFLADCKKYNNPYLTEYEPRIRKALKSLYNNDMEALDLMVGCALEKKYPGFQIPDTIYYLFTVQTQRRIEDDVFFTEKLTSEYYTEFGMKVVEDITMARVLKIAYPELNEKFADDDNVFMVWNSKDKKKVQRPSFINTFYQQS